MSMTDTELASRVTRTLRAKAAQVPETVEPFAPEVTTLTTDPARPSRARVLVTTAAAALLVMATAFGLTVALRGGGDGGTRAAAPSGQPVASVSIEAEPTLRFQAHDFYTRPGLNEIDFSSAGGTHTLVFADPDLSAFRLSATTNQVISGRVELAAGRDYTVFCAIPGHRQAGMEAVIHVAAAGEQPTTGTLPAVLPTLPNGSVDRSQLPDYVAIPISEGDGSRAGYVKLDDLIGTVRPDPTTVYADDLHTVVGYSYSGRGFVPVGVDPDSLPQNSTTTTLGAGG